MGGVEKVWPNTRTAPVLLIVILAGSVTGFLTGLGGRKAADLPSRAPEVEIGQSRKTHPQAQTVLRLDWSSVESEDLQQYIANLRGIGCPEKTIADIIRAKVDSDYLPRFNQSFNPLAKYWSSDEERATLSSRLQAIREERDRLLKSLGIEPNEGTPEDSSPAANPYVAEALKLYPKAVMGPNSSPEEWQEFLKNRRQRISYLSQFLSPEDLLNYRIADDGNSGGIRSVLKAINSTDDEFRKAFATLDGENLNATNGYLAAELESRLREALGEQRYAELCNQRTPENALFNGFVLMFDLTDEQTEQLRQLRLKADSMELSEYKARVAQILQRRFPLEQYFENPLLYRGKR